MIESFRHGTPVIARNIGPFPEIVRKAGAGELFDDREGLRLAMARFTSDDGLVDRLGDAGRRGFRSHWCESVVVPAYLALVARTAEKRGMTRVLEKLENSN